MRVCRFFINDTRYTGYLLESFIEKILGAIKYPLPLIFEFNPPSKPGFWMLGVNKDLNIAFVRNNHVVEIHTMKAHSLKILKPKTKIDFAIEFEGTFISVGDTVVVKQTS